MRLHVLVVALLSVPALALAQDRRAPMEAPSEKLELTASTPEHVAGTYTRGGTLVRFDSQRTGATMKLELRDAAGKALFQGMVEGKSFSMSLLDGRMKVTGPLPADRKKTPLMETSGDSQGLTAFKESAEYRLLPYLSRALGVQGITGRSHPASLPLHFLAQASARAYKVRLAPLDPQAAKIAPLPPPQAVSEAVRNNAFPAVPPVQCFDQQGDPCGDDCFGMCGADCNCWSWVCGDCCVYNSCLQHDYYCSECECGVSSVACVACYVPIWVFVEICSWQNDPCPDESSCDCSSLTQCGQISGTDCGWCKKANFSSGYFGSSSGPNQGSCVNWIWDHNDCNCLSFTSCSQISGTGCGWCTTPQQAMPGSTGGPTYQPSSGACRNWIWDHNDCNCATFTSCSQIAGTDCGWCTTLQQAMPGSTSGPSYQPPGSNCGGSNWIWDHNDCP